MFIRRRNVRRQRNAYNCKIEWEMLRNLLDNVKRNFCWIVVTRTSISSFKDGYFVKRDNFLDQSGVE